MIQKCFIFFLCLALLFLAAAGSVFAQSTGATQVFYINPVFHPEQKEQISAVLQKKSEHAHFYIENKWVQGLSDKGLIIISQALDDLAQEFDQTIYPGLTKFYGQEWRPGIDHQIPITVLFHRTKNQARGYFRETDEYPQIQAQNSNEREMVYLDADILFGERASSLLAHEFTHLITFNQKNRLRGVKEEVWLNELRAEYAPTFLGYDRNYQGSNLQERLKSFISSPSDSLVKWQNQKQDYGVVNLFAQYLTDHYGPDILSLSLQTNKTGLDSLNYALEQKDIAKDLSQIFSDWTIAVLVNNCQINPVFCYKNKNLQDFKITPSLIFLPSTQKTGLSLDYKIQPWTGN